MTWKVKQSMFALKRLPNSDFPRFPRESPDFQHDLPIMNFLKKVELKSLPEIIVAFVGHMW